MLDDTMEIDSSLQKTNLEKILCVQRVITIENPTPEEDQDGLKDMQDGIKIIINVVIIKKF